MSDRVESSADEVAPGASEPEDEKIAAQRAKAFNGLSAREWTALSRNVWNDVSSPRNKRHLEHGAVYPRKLAERLITMYSRPGDLIFDPFAGIGTTLIAAHGLDRPSVGIELNPRFVELANEWIDEERDLFSLDRTAPTLYTEDARNMEQLLEPASVQASVTSPPYADFIRRSVADREKTHKTSRIVHDNNSRVRAYSDDPRDFGNLAYGDFLRETRELLASLYAVTMSGGYSAWVVKDYRLPPERPYVSFHSDLAHLAEEVGWLWHDLVVWDQNQHRRLVLLGYPSRFYTNQNCSFIVVLRRP